MNARHENQHCTCMSGLTEAQVKLLELGGALGALEVLAMSAHFAHTGPAPIGDPALAARLEKLRLLIVQAIEFCREHGWKRGES